MSPFVADILMPTPNRARMWSVNCLYVYVMRTKDG